MPNSSARPSSLAARTGAGPARRSWLGLALSLGLLIPLGPSLSGCTRGEPTSTAPTTATSPGSDSATGASSTGSTEPTASTSTAGTGSAGSTGSTDSTASTASTASTDTTDTTGAGSALANVLSVSVRGTSWSVELGSPDLGCSQYADWWEVVTPEGELVYRRILAHSHVDEQPFTRSGGPVEVGADDVVIVRAHMNPGGYGGQALRGNASGGFSIDPTITASFAAGLESSEPLPSGCAF